MKTFRYRLPLKWPLRLGKARLTYRQGIILQSAAGWSDVAPLPGFSPETIQDVISQFGKTRDAHSASLRFGTDALSRPLSPCSIPVNALLQGTATDVLARARELADSDCKAVKLKVGQDDIANDVELVQRVRSELGADQRLRLDANRAWDFEAACQFARGVTDCSIEYIEEPLQDALRLEDFHAQTGLNYALDETLTEQEPLSSFPNVAAFVYKPTLLGGRDRIDQLATMGKPIVFSACFESGVGIARIAQLAQEYSPEVPAGLDTYAWLAKDLLVNNLNYKRWRLEIKADEQIDFELLDEIRP